MKKLFSLLFVAVVAMTLLASCEADNKFQKSEGVLTYEEFVNVPCGNDVSNSVVIETFIQDKQSWYEYNGVGVASFYTQDDKGGYFLYNMPCSKADFDNVLTIGTKIRVTGIKSVWSGEVEITDATYEVLEGRYVARSLNITSSFGTDDMNKYQNMLVAINDLEVVASKDKEGATHPFLYNWDGSGSDGNDLYFTVTNGTVTLTFTVESYLRGAGTPVYETVKSLKVGDKIDVEGFLYWYNGAQPHVTNVKVK